PAPALSDNADGTGTMLLLSDGTVMVQRGAGYTGNIWYKLTPDARGSYANGAWSPLASMGLARQFYASNVLTNGKVFVVGGEYSGLHQPGSPTDTSAAEVYNPVTNTWSPAASAPPATLGDKPSAVLADGKILVGSTTG